MSRQQLLYKLLEKADKGNQYMYSQFCELAQGRTPPATIKRMQILQMGSCKINAPNARPPEEPIFQKQGSANNKRVFVLQKVKFTPRDQDAIKNGGAERGRVFVALDTKYSSTPAHSAQKNSIQNVKTEADSPLRQNASAQKTISISQSTKNSHSLRKDFQTAKSQKYCLLKSSQIKNDSKQLESQPAFRRKLSNSSRISKAVDTSLHNHKEEQKRLRIELRKEVNKNYQKAFTPPPKISAKSFIVYEMVAVGAGSQPEIRIHTAFNSKIKVQIASLTKIMTCIVAIELCGKYGFKAEQQEIRIGKFQSAIGGTSANVQMGDVYTLHDLLHGLMLPSGNDASLAIAVWAGKKLLQKKQQLQGQLIPRKKMKKQCYTRFIQEMNIKAQELGMTKTNYANSHGLINLLNRSCAHDIAVLSYHCMKNSYFCAIVGCKFYSRKIKVETKIVVEKQRENMGTSLKIQESAKNLRNTDNEEDQQLSDVDSEAQSQTDAVQKQEDTPAYEQQVVTSQREVSWQNTHRLLYKSNTEYLGIKTGVTTAAGPCLSSCVQTPCGRRLFIVVLNCRKLQLRFKETEILRKWVYKKEGIVKVSKSEIGSKSTKSQIDGSDKDDCESMDEVTSGKAID